MSKLITVGKLGKAFAARYPIAATVDLQASAGTVQVQASAFRGFSVGGGKIVPVKAIENFFVAGQVVPKGDVVEVPEGDAKSLVNAGKAKIATDADIAATKGA